MLFRASKGSVPNSWFRLCPFIEIDGFGTLERLFVRQGMF